MKMVIKETVINDNKYTAYPYDGIEYPDDIMSQIAYELCLQGL